MLQLMTRRSSEMAAIFTQLFQRNPPARIFRFLDEEATFIEDARLMASLPLLPFLSALVKLKLFKRL
jgi:lycopene beta-cyclase